MSFWLAKTEPDTFSYADLEHLKKDMWDGVRNFTAAKHIKNMHPGDLIFIYHSGKEKAIVGVAEAVSEPYPDPTSSDPRFVTVDVIPRHRLTRPVTLREIKALPNFSNWELVRQSRLSVMPVSESHWQLITKLSEQP
ncbi:EVE domain-containing protein [Sporomusa sp.]|uniref:EVE domain-containing protein n=1 Tax=Sporomusa sp. TaxID=2078658 RepID=UPI002B817785|nr:EVE domain-containing protein [Sporomusa sp.]HWR43382.1 EVE domain-containing protein [Sporomusa sp.]